MSYGVRPSGFVRKPLTTILTDIETKNLQIFGPELIQTAATGLGQLNGMAADLAAELWELGEDIYGSFDPHQAEGNRLDALAKHRLLERTTGESDESLRQAITRQDRARIDTEDFERALWLIEGVTYAKVWVNDTDATDANGLAAHSVAVAIIGGADQEIGEVMHRYIVPGIGTSGTTIIEPEIDGYCRTMFIIRPTELLYSIVLTVKVGYDKITKCPPPNRISIIAGLYQYLTDPITRPINGEDLTVETMRVPLAQLFGATVEYVSVTYKLEPDGSATPPPITIAFDAIAVFDPNQINVVIQS